MKKSASAPRRAVTPSANVESARALLRAARLYRTEHEKLKRMPRGSGFDRRWTQVADRARLARSLFLALLDDATRAAPRLAR